MTHALVLSNQGPLVVASGATFSASGVRFESNQHPLGGAVHGEPGSIVILSNSRFAANAAEVGATFSGVILKSNVAERGGGLHVGSLDVVLPFPSAGFTTAQLSNLTVNDNAAFDGAGVSVHDATAIITKGSFANGVASDRGGALLVTGGALVTSTAEFVDNGAKGRWSGNDGLSGGALFMTDGGVASLGAVAFDGNTGREGPLAMIERDGELSIGAAAGCPGLTPAAQGHLDPAVYLSELGQLTGTGWQLPVGTQQYFDEVARKAFTLP